MVDWRKQVRWGRTELNAVLTRSRLALYVGWTGHRNLGDEALLQCIQRLFRDHLFLYDKPYIGRGISYRIGREQRFDCVMLGGGTLINRADEYLRRLQSTRARFKVVFGAGVADPDFWRNELGQPVAQDMAKWVSVLNNEIAYLGVRGPRSVRLLEEGGVTRPIEILGDPALTLARDTLYTPRRRGVIGLNVCRCKDLLWGQSDDAFLNRFEEISRALMSKGWDLVYFPMSDEDVAPCRQMVASVRASGGRASMERITDPEAFVERMTAMDLFIGEKLHAVVLAACALVPVIMMEYRPKCRDFMDSMGLTDFCRQVNQVTLDWVLDRVDVCLRDEALLRKKMLDTASSYKARQKSAAAKIIAMLD